MMLVQYVCNLFKNIIQVLTKGIIVSIYSGVIFMKARCHILYQCIMQSFLEGSVSRSFVKKTNPLFSQDKIKEM